VKDLKKIIKGCLRQNRSDQYRLYANYSKRMFGVCLRYAASYDEAQDILQEAFIKVFKNISQFQQAGSMEGWIRKIVTNTAIDMLRQKNKMERYIEEEPSQKDNTTENEAFSHLGSDEILAQVARLPEGARVIFNLYAIEGYTHKEIARLLEITTGTSKSQFNRARKLLQNHLAEINT